MVAYPVSDNNILGRIIIFSRRASNDLHRNRRTDLDLRDYMDADEVRERTSRFKYEGANCQSELLVAR